MTLPKKQVKKETIKAWAVSLKDDGFIPSFNVGGKMKDVMQIHAFKSSAMSLAKNIGKGWEVVSVTITYHHNYPL